MCSMLSLWRMLLRVGESRPRGVPSSLPPADMATEKADAGRLPDSPAATRVYPSFDGMHQ